MNRIELIESLRRDADFLRKTDIFVNDVIAKRMSDAADMLEQDNVELSRKRGLNE